MKNIILINGLIRDKNIFYESIEIYNLLKKDNIIDDVIIIVDKELLNEKDNKPLGNIIDDELRKILNDNNIKIIEVNNLSIEYIKKNIDPLIETRPKNKLRQNTITGLSLWRPMYSLKQGLLNIEDNSFILKTRPDVKISYNLIKKIFTEYKIKLLDNELLEYKIWSTGFNEKELLYIMDFAFFGKKEDLLKACHMNGEYLKWGYKSPTGVNNFNTIWWIDIFYKKYKIIKDYYNTYVNQKSEIKTYDELLYKNCMDLYYEILDKYFIIDSGINDFFIKQSWGNLDIFNSNDGINIPNNGRCEFKNSNWINKNLKIIKSEFIDYYDLKTELCILGEKYGTDKSPFNKKPFVHGGPGHRHPYTCFYNSLFKDIRHKKLNIIEIGIAFGDSIKMFSEYFYNSNIISVDHVDNSKDLINQIHNCKFDYIDVTKENTIISVFEKYGPFDIIIDDASHKFNDQIRVIKNANNHLNKDGLLIIEDIFEDKDIFMKYNNEKYKTMSYFSDIESKQANNLEIDELYNLKLKEFKKNYKSISFYTLRHNNIYTPGWNNNKVLLFRN